MAEAGGEKTMKAERYVGRAGNGGLWLQSLFVLHPEQTLVFRLFEKGHHEVGKWF